MIEATVVIKPFPTEQPRDLSATSRYMSDIAHGGKKIPLDENGIPMSGAINCVSGDRQGQLHEMETLLRLHGNPRSTQAALHCVMSYPAGMHPTREQIERDLKINLKKQGMEDHLLVWDAHDNTDHFHVHFLLCRVVPYSESGKYPLANNGLVKVTRKDKRGRFRTRTDEAACRQAAVAEINEHYGYGTDGLTHDKHGKPQHPNKQKDKHSDKTRAGERKTGKKSKERQLSETAQKIFELSRSWHECDQLFGSYAMEMTFKTVSNKIVGGYITGPDNRKCAFSKCGPGCSYPDLQKRFGTPTPNDAACINEYHLMPFEYQDLLTPEEAKKRLLPIFKDAQSWPHLLSDIQAQGMILERAGGGLVVRFNDNSDSIKCSEISNKYSLSKLETVFGPCPIPKAAQLQSSARDLLRQEAEAILSKHVAQGHGLYWMESDFSRANIRLTQKTFQQHDGERKYWAIERDGISVPLSSIAKKSDGTPVYSMWLLEKFDRQDTTLQKAKVLACQARKTAIENKRWCIGGDLYEAYQREALQQKQRKIEKLSFFAAIVQFIKHKTEKHDVHTNSPGTHQPQSDVTESSQGEFVLKM